MPTSSELLLELKELLGETLGEKYELRELLGAGGMGAVYAARNQWTKKDVALKVLIDRGDADRESVKRFKREARAASRLDHPHIVQIFDLGHEEGMGYFIVQELLRGETLSDLLEEGALGLREALEVLVPIASALGEAHAAGVVHRDLKPANIFVVETPEGRTPKLIDFGISKIVAKHTTTSVSDLTKGATIGTLDYISPEQAIGDEDVGPKTDVWGFGAVLFRTLAGRPMFEAPGLGVIGKILKEDAPPLRSVAPEVPEDVSAAVAKMVQRDAAARLPNMGAVLRELLGAESVLKEPWGRELARRFAEDVEGELPEIPEEAPERAGMPRWVPWLIAAACAGLAAWALLGT